MDDTQQLAEEVRRLKRERNAVVLAHYYVDGAVQDVADFVGDSYGLAKRAASLDCDEIVFAGVRFMGESAKLLSPEKRVLMPAPDAGCPMASMADVETIERVRAAHPGIAVVCYVNSTAAVKAASDVCVTSSNAERIVSALAQRQIFFTPDRHLGHYLSERLPEKEFILNPGFCPIHEAVQLSEIKELEAAHPEARVLMHPECPQWVLGEADYVGSTAGIIEAAVEGDAPAYIIVTVCGVLHEIEKRAAGQGKRFYFPKIRPVCPNMRKVTLRKVRDCLRDGTGEVPLPPADVCTGARAALERMLELAR